MKSAIWFVTAALVLLVACGGGTPQESAAPDSGPVAVDTPAAPVVAAAAIVPKSGSGVSGTATFTYENGQVTLTVELQGAPAGEHGFHIHEVGDCSAEDASSAGGHWNPGDVAHGKWGEQPFHLGDVGNVRVGEDGYGSLTLTTDLWSIDTGQVNDVVGKSVLVHAKADDFLSQPTGAAGGRIGCGVVRGS